MDYIQDLNEKQCEAVMTTEGYVRVIAGAGSGKTKLLVSRYAYLVMECGIDPANILCVTFTNKAAGEMRKRIRSIIGAEHDTSLVCTYHGFCAKLLRENAEKLFLPKNFQIIDTYQQKAILEEVYQKFELKLDHASFEYTLKRIGEFKSNTDYVIKMCNPAPCTICYEDKILEEFFQRQKAIYALDFHDLLSYALYLLQTNKDVRDKWQSRLNYIQVDEFQDSSLREMELIDILSGTYKNVMIVGDPDQNIYEWRGSDVRLLVEFDKQHEPTQTIFLNRNYRSTPQILACANSVIDKNELRLKKELYTLSDNGAEVIHFHSQNDEEEVSRIVGIIKKITQENRNSFSDFAILYRSSFLSRVVEKKLIEVNIPYEVFGGVKFYQRMEVQDIIAYLRVIALDDDVSFKRIVNKPRRKIGKAKLAMLEYLQESGSLSGAKSRESLFAKLAEHHSDSIFKNSGASQFVSFVQGLRDGLSSMRISEIVNKICSESGYEQYIRELGDEERLDNLAEFKRIANEFERNFGEDLSAQEFLQQIALQFNEDEGRQDDSVKLMTIHSAKGLEFPVVFIIGLSERIFPSSKTIEERQKLGLEEERRLCYVAITRAKERLFLMDNEGNNIYGDSKLPSRFLFEIGENNYRRIGEISRKLKSDSIMFAKKTSFTDETDAPVKVNETVEHHIFGKGKVIAYDNKRDIYTVKFDNLDYPRNISKSYFETKHSPIKLPAPEQQATNGDEITAKKNALKLVKPKTSENLWKRDDVPHSGWQCIGITDMGAPTCICQMCGYQIIRYVHHMFHPNYGTLDVGCVCAGKMEGNIERARQREKELRNRKH